MTLSPRILLADPDDGGHHRLFFNAFADALVDMGADVVAAAPFVDDVSPRVRDRIRLSASPMSRLKLGPLRTALHAARRWSDLEHAARGHRFDVVMLPMLDGYVDKLLPPSLPTALLGTPYTGLFFHAFDQRFPEVRSRLGAHTSSLRGAGAIGVLDEGVAHELQRDTRRPVVAFPDFDPTPVARRGHPLVEHHRRGRGVVALLGVLQRRKGVLDLLRAAAHARASEHDLLFVVGGHAALDTFSADERNELLRHRQTPQPNVLWLPPLDDEAFQQAVVSADVLWTAYNDFPSSSNLLTKAARHHTPVIVREGALMAERIRKHGFGVVVDDMSARHVVSAVRSAMHLGDIADACDVYAAEHNLERLAPALQSLLTSSLR